MKKKKRTYYRTAALLGAQTPVASRGAANSYAGRTRDVRVPWKLFAVLTPLLILLSWLLLADAWFLLLENVRVYGAPSTEVVRQILYASDLMGRHSFFLRPHEAESLVVAGVPGVRALSVTCGFYPAECEFSVRMRPPVMVWVAGAETYWLDSEGTLFPAYGERADLPRVRGLLPSEESAHSIIAVQQGVAALVALGLPTDGLEYNSRRGLVWTDPEGCRLALGVGPDMAERWQMYRHLKAHLASQGVVPQAIDVRFPGGVTYTTEDVSW